uniref:Ornithine carbamoyltransferase n=1 Tax=candidate division WOR-3 bacterium TaxID=2052148 RepID=A0A7C6E9Q0_UNCW3
MKKDLCSISDLTADEIYHLFTLAQNLKEELKTAPILSKLRGKIIALVFEKPSLRTRVTFQVAAFSLGANSIYLSPSDIGLGKREAVKDVANNLSLWVSAIIARTFAHKTVLELAQYAKVSVINALSDLEHPCQVLADFLTIYEIAGKIKDIKIAWIGDGNNVCHSLILGAAILGANLWVATPKGYEPQRAILNKAFELAKTTEAKILLTNDPNEAVKNSQFIYTDTWVSMGEEEKAQIKKQAFLGFQVNEKLLKNAPADYKVMHCLPAHRGEEITDDVIDGPHSIVLNQAENRLHIQRAILAQLLG